VTLSPASTFPPPGTLVRTRRAFTLTEFMVTASIFFMVIGGVIYAHIFGLRMVRLTEMAANTSESDRRLLRNLAADLATAKSWDLGFGSAASFSRLAGFRPQQANGLQIYPTTNTTPYIRLYLDTGVLYRMTNGSVTPEAMAKPVLNSVIFSIEDSKGNVLSNRVQGAVLGLNLQLQDYSPQTWGIAAGKETHWVRAKLKSRADD
jgi:hypothetical protein